MELKVTDMQTNEEKKSSTLVVLTFTVTKITLNTHDLVVGFHK